MPKLVVLLRKGLIVIFVSRFFHPTKIKNKINCSFDERSFLKNHRYSLFGKWTKNKRLDKIGFVIRTLQILYSVGVGPPGPTEARNREKNPHFICEKKERSYSGRKLKSVKALKI